MKKNSRTGATYLVLALLAAAFVSCAGAPKNAKTQTYQAFSGKVTAIEKYGHAVTDIPFADMQKAGYAHGDVVTVTFDNGFTFDAPVVSGYEVDKGAYLVRTGYASGFIAACINYGKLNVTAKIDVGSKITVSMKQKAGYYEQYEVRSLARTDKREDYSSDEVFANFRAVSGGSIGKNIVFRGSHPAKKGWTRATFVSKLMEQAGIVTVINMSDSADELAAYLDAANPQASAYYRSISEKGNVVCLSMNTDFTSSEFAAQIVAGLRFMISHKGPYYIHCNEGKDRTGFMGILLESLAGATKEEMLADYMQSYINFYHVEKGTKKFDIIAKTNFDPMLASIAGTKTPAEGAKAYLTSHGMSDTEISSLLSILK